MSLRPHLQAKNLPRSSKAPWKALSCEALKDLAKKIKKAFNWEHTPKPFQLDAIKAQLQRKDVVVHASTGSGKTLIVAGPHALSEMKGKVTILVSPLIALQEEQVITFQREFGLNAIAINSSNGGLTKEKINDILAGKYAIVIASPEMVLSKMFIAQVIRNRHMSTRLLSVVIDEAHVVSHWGSGFRKKYGALGILKALVPRGTSFAALSATLPPRVRNDVIKKLQLDENTMVDLNLGNDRPNVSLVIRAMHHPMNSYRDLNFIIPPQLEGPQHIKKTFIYADSLAMATAIEDYLYELCPVGYHYTGFIRPYSAAFSTDYREAVMKLFHEGKVRVLICTDAAGMGCNIPDIDIVVQWKLPASISAFVQRAGRAARGDGRVGLAVLLVERSVYEADIIKYIEEKQNSQVTKKSRKTTVRESSVYSKASKDYAKAQGVLRGGHNGENDATHSPVEVPLDGLSLDEGLYTLVQTGTCRRKILTKVFNNNAPHPSAPCCDICVPQLLDLTRPGPLKTDKRDSNIKRGIPDISVMNALQSWRSEIARRDFKNALFTGSGILENDIVELLSSVGPIESMDKLTLVLAGQWSHWFHRYGTELLTTLQTLAIGPLKPKPRKATGKKPAELSTGAIPERVDGNHETAGTKRRRLDDIASSSGGVAATSSVHAPSPMAVNERHGRANKKSRVDNLKADGGRMRSEAADMAAVTVDVPHGNLLASSNSHHCTPRTPARQPSTNFGSSTLARNNPYAHLLNLNTPFRPYTQPVPPLLQAPITPLSQYSSSPNTVLYPGHPPYYFTPYILPRPPPPPPPPST